MRRSIFKTIAFLVLGLGASSNAVAQSFDCKRAATTIEKIICGDDYGNLRDVDAALGKAFSRRIQGTSAAESRRLLLEQRAWLARRLDACHLSLNLQFVELAPYDWSCLDELYRERIAALNHKPIDLVYSGDNQVCPRLHQSLNIYHARKPAEWSFLLSLPTILELSGFETVRWLDPKDADVFLGRSFPHPGMVFEGDVFGDGTTRFVNLNYRTLGLSQVAYSGYVALLKEQMTLATVVALIPELADRNRGFQHLAILDLFVGFQETLDMSSSTQTTDVRIFSRDPRIRFVSNVGISTAAIEFLDARDCPICEGAQDAFVIDGRVYFFRADEPFHEFGFLYRLTADLSVEIVCLTKGNTQRYIPG